MDLPASRLSPSAAVSSQFPSATTPEPAAAELTILFDFNIPQRWSIAHLYVDSEKLLGGVFFLCHDKVTDVRTGVVLPIDAGFRRPFRRVDE